MPNLSNRGKEHSEGNQLVYEIAQRATGQRTKLRKSLRIPIYSRRGDTANSLGKPPRAKGMDREARLMQTEAVRAWKEAIQMRERLKQSC